MTAKLGWWPTLGYAGVYSGFLRHGESSPPATTSTPAPCRKRPGRLGMVGEQENMLVNIALALTAAAGVAGVTCAAGATTGS